MKKRYSLLMFLIVGLMISGCSPLVVRYQSNINNPARVKSNIIVRYETSKIDVQFLDLQTQQTITDAITTDLQKNLFFGGKEEVDVLVKVEQLEYSNRPWGILWFPLVIVGLPTGKAEGVAQVAMDIRHSKGQLLRSYRVNKVESHWYNTAYYNKDVLIASDGGITKDALKKAVEEIKLRVIDDRYQIVQAIEKLNNQQTSLAIAGELLGGVSDVDTEIPLSQMKNPDAVAVVIGISDYQIQGVPKVEHAAQDAATMRQYLVKVLGYDEKNILPRNPDQVITAGVFKTLIRSQLPTYIKPGISDVFVYFSGHGAPSTSSQKAFFVPADCDPNFVNPDNAYLLDSFYDDLAKLDCNNLTVVLDACFSGYNGKGDMLLQNASPLFLTVEHPLLAKENAVLFAASQSDQVSNWYPAKQHGMFTYFFLKGLKGDADRNKDGSISISDLEDYLCDQNTGVPYWSKREFQRLQMPQISSRHKEKIMVSY